MRITIREINNFRFLILGADSSIGEELTSTFFEKRFGLFFTLFCHLNELTIIITI